MDEHFLKEYVTSNYMKMYDFKTDNNRNLNIYFLNCWVNVHVHVINLKETSMNMYFILKKCIQIIV